MTKSRIAKVIARSGLCSRRDAERMIFEGRVQLNGKILITPAMTVEDPYGILADGKPLREEDVPRLWMYHKPKGLVTTHKDPEGRPTVFGVLSKELPRVLSIGRLDLNSEGLLLLTNDGGISRHLESPKTAWARVYRVRVYGRVTQDKLSSLKDGITIEGIHYGSIEASLDNQKNDNAWMTITLREGKNREIRKIMEYFGWQVNRLIRISYGPFELGNLAPGEWMEVPQKALKHHLTQKGHHADHRRPIPRTKAPKA